jgi:NADH-quinone oxidoreductase subunit G
MPTITINGEEISVDEGTLILDAAKEAGFYIPTFCYQADLIGIGACRMCIVEVEGQQKLVPSCVTPVMDGMNVLTETETVNAARAAMLEFLLAKCSSFCSPTTDWTARYAIRAASANCRTKSTSSVRIKAASPK